MLNLLGYQNTGWFSWHIGWENRFLEQKLSLAFLYIFRVWSWHEIVTFRWKRSSQCPMCWQPNSLKNPTRFLLFNIYVNLVCVCCQELPEVVERKKNPRLNLSRNATILHHTTLGDFELQHFCCLLMLFGSMLLHCFFESCDCICVPCSCPLAQMMLIF